MSNEPVCSVSEIEMPPTKTNAGEISVTELISGIVADVQDLAVKHLALLKSEVMRDLDTTREALIYLGLGAVLCTIGGLVLCHMSSHLIHELVPAIPLWGGYGIVGGMALLFGAIPIRMGICQLRKLSPLSDGGQLQKGVRS